ncbi:hypothetical protein ACIGFK_34455 [Streptomyces sp. NPDC085524]|uniref:hypothetical protein n=1 Tax=unclassified Streptomyces TaxID=2593676 RepID=UPI0035DFC542
MASNGPNHVWAEARVERGATGTDHGPVAHSDGTRRSAVAAAPPAGGHPGHGGHRRHLHGQALTVVGLAADAPAPGEEEPGTIPFAVRGFLKLPLV